jgi:hypothetical protein
MNLKMFQIKRWYEAEYGPMSFWKLSPEKIGGIVVSWCLAGGR